MVRSGMRVIRFHKWYYIFLESDPRPECLGLKIAREIPADAAKYQEWLAAQRKSAEEWEALYEDFLSVKPGYEVTTDLPDFMLDQLPTPFAPPDEGWLEWIYIVDLDREIFSVTDEDHFKLEQVPHIAWIDAICGGTPVDQVSLPDPVPMEGVTDFLNEHTIKSGELSSALNNVTMSDTALDPKQMVVPKDIKDIPWRQRHGPILRAITFHFWSYANQVSLAAIFLQQGPQDLPFREMAYAVLCLAAGGRHFNLLPSRNVSSKDTFSFVHEGPKYNADSEFVSILASGAHLQGSSPGTSPEGTIYWLDNVLVVLTAQLYRPSTADEGIALIVLYCQNHRSDQYVDAVLISVEHVLLVHVTPDGKVQHTAVMPLLDRHAKPYWQRREAECQERLEKWDKKQRKIYQQRQLRNEAIDLSHGMNSNEEVESDEEDESALYTTQVDGNINSTFYALVHLFEAAACKHMPVAKVTAGRFPNEIYTQIIMHVHDMETRESLMKVSRALRRICQEDLLLHKALIVKPSYSCQSCDEATRIPNWFEKFNTVTGIHSRAAASRSVPPIIYIDDEDQSPTHSQATPRFYSRMGSSWQVAIGTEHNKRSLLAKVVLAF